MRHSRRQFIGTAFAAGIGTALPACNSGSINIKTKYTALDEIMNKPVFKREFFTDPVIIESAELLRLANTFLCRVRPESGADGLSLANNDKIKSLWPVFMNKLRPFFPGKDARDLEKILADIYVYQSNYKMQNLAI